MGRRRSDNEDFSIPSDFGKSTTKQMDESGVSPEIGGWVHGREGRPVNELSPDDADKRRRAVEAKRAYEAERKALPPGVSASDAQSVSGTGPEAKDFPLLAAAAPELAAAQVDKWATAMGVIAKGPADPALSTYYKGTSGPNNVPFYTNLPPGASSVKGVKDLKPFEDTAGGGTVGDSLGADERDPRKRAIAEKVRSARALIALGPKSADVVAGEVSKHFDAADKDVRTMGEEGARRKWLSMVEKGQLSDAGYQGLLKETTDSAARRNESDYAVLRDKILPTAREHGVNAAIEQLNNARRNQGEGGDPKNYLRIESELRHLGRSMADPEAQINANAYLPLSEGDVQFFKNQGATPPGSKSIKPDPKSPPTMLNEHDGPTRQEASNEVRDMSIEELSAMMAKGTGDVPARSGASYSAASARERANPTPMADEYIAANMQQFNSEETAAQRNRKNMMSPKDWLDYLAAGGNMARMQKNRDIKLRRATAKAAR